MSGYAMGRALAWALVRAESGPGPYPRPLGGSIEYQEDFDSAKYIGVVGLS